MDVDIVRYEHSSGRDSVTLHFFGTYTKRHDIFLLNELWHVERIVDSTSQWAIYGLEDFSEHMVS